MQLVLIENNSNDCNSENMSLDPADTVMIVKYWILNRKIQLDYPTLNTLR